MFRERRRLEWGGSRVEHASHSVVIADTAVKRNANHMALGHRFYRYTCQSGASSLSSILLSYLVHQSLEARGTPKWGQRSMPTHSFDHM